MIPSLEDILNSGLCHTNIVLKTIHFAFGCKPSVSGSLLNDLKLNELFLNSSLRPSFDKLIIRSFQHICMCLVCVLRAQTEFCLKYGDYSSIAACAALV